MSVRFSLQKLFFVSAVCLLTQVPALALDAPGRKDYSAELKIPDVVARVNGVEVPSKFVRFKYNQILEKSKATLNAGQKKDLARDIIEKEVTREMLLQYGKKSEKHAPQDRVNDELEKLKSGYPNPKSFEEALKERDIDVDTLRKSIELDLISHEILEEQIRDKIQVGDDSVKKFYDENHERFKRPESYRVQHIFLYHFPPNIEQTTPSDKVEAKKKELSAQAKSKIQQVMKEVQAKKQDFAELAKKYSQDEGSAPNGGDLDYIYKGLFPPEFDEAVGKLKVGEVSPIVRTNYGYHIIKLNEIKPSDYASLDTMRDSIRQYLFMGEARKLIDTFMDKLRKDYKVETLYN